MTPKIVWMVALPGRPWMRILAASEVAVRAAYPAAQVVWRCIDQTLSVDREVTP